MGDKNISHNSSSSVKDDKYRSNIRKLERGMHKHKKKAVQLYRSMDHQFNSQIADVKSRFQPYTFLSLFDYLWNTQKLGNIGIFSDEIEIHL